MGLWKDKTRGDWRYRFEYQKQNYAAGGFKTRADARAAREERRKRVKSAILEPQPILTDITAYSNTLNQYLDWSERRHARGHYDNKCVVFRRLSGFLGEDVPLSRLTTATLHSFLSTAPSNNAYNAYRKEISSFFNWSKRHVDQSIVNPCELLEKMPNPRKERDIPTRTEFLQLLSACGPNEKPLIVVLAHSLGRIDEILRMTWRDINFEKKVLVLWSRKNRAGDWKPRTIGMNGDLEAMLLSMWRRREQDKWVFYNARKHDRYLRRPKLMKTLCKRAGISFYTFHQIRHFMATYMHDIMKVPTGVLSGILGHENKRTTEIYLHSVDEAQREAMMRLEGVFMDKDACGYACGFKEKQGKS